MKLQKTRGQYTVTLPKAIVEAKGWKKGDDLNIVIDNLGQVILKVS